MRKRQPSSTGRVVEIPKENFIDAVLDGCFQVKGLRLQGDQLDIYSVTDLSGGNATLEAQAFPLTYPVGKFLKSRMRKNKRMYRSRNFQCVFNWDGRRFFVSQVVRSEAELKNLVAENGRHQDGDDGESDEDFPPLTNESSLKHPSPPPARFGAGWPGRPNYAEVATRGQKLEMMSGAPPGVRPRRRRPRRKEEGGPREHSR